MSTTPSSVPVSPPPAATASCPSGDASPSSTTTLERAPPNGIAIIHQGYIYGFLNDPGVGRRFEALVQRQHEEGRGGKGDREGKNERRDFILEFGERRGKVMWDTRSQTAEGRLNRVDLDGKGGAGK
jgi:hypothetical protein